MNPTCCPKGEALGHGTGRRTSSPGGLTQGACTQAPLAAHRLRVERVLAKGHGRHVPVLASDFSKMVKSKKKILKKNFEKKKSKKIN
jgi:hypothetical protein